MSSGRPPRVRPFIGDGFERPPVGEPCPICGGVDGDCAINTRHKQARCHRENSGSSGKFTDEADGRLFWLHALSPRMECIRKSAQLRKHTGSPISLDQVAATPHYVRVPFEGTIIAAEPGPGPGRRYSALLTIRVDAPCYAGITIQTIVHFYGVTLIDVDGEKQRLRTVDPRYLSLLQVIGQSQPTWESMVGYRVRLRLAAFSSGRIEDDESYFEAPTGIFHERVPWV